MSSPVKDMDKNLRITLDNMAETMYYERGIGISAVQVGILSRIIIMDVNVKYNCHDHGCHELHDLEKNPIYLINPKIVHQSKELSTYDEGCLSFPGIRVEITRPAQVKVEFFDYSFKPQTLEMKGLMATCIQHEMDHLNGITLLDHLSKLKREMILKKLDKLNKNKM